MAARLASVGVGVIWAREGSSGAEREQTVDTTEPEKAPASSLASSSSSSPTDSTLSPTRLSPRTNQTMDASGMNGATAQAFEAMMQQKQARLLPVLVLPSRTPD